MQTQGHTTGKRLIDEKTENLVAMGAAMGANCIPCFEHLYEKAVTSGITPDEIREVVLVASKVKNGANIVLLNSVNELLGIDESHDLPCDIGSSNACAC